MSKQEFLMRLCKGLSELPQNEIEERLTFYSEMIDDRMEEGLSEEEAISAIGSIDEIITQAVTETPLTKIAMERIKPKRRLSAGEVVLLVLGSPIWLSLLIAAFAVILSVYAALCSVIISLWAVFGSLIGCAFGGIVAGIGFAFGGNALTGMAMIGAGVVCVGLSIFMFYGCKMTTKGILILTKKVIIWIKNCFMKKEEA